MKKIELTKGRVALVDDDDFELLSRWEWRAMWTKSTQSFYAIRTEGKRPFRKTVLMHRQIMNTPTELNCDHRNHNTLDNRKENLRNATRSQNQMNRRGAQANNKLGERCISSQKGGLRVQVNVGGKCVYDKNFRKLEDAIAARDAVLKEHHGEFSA